MDEGMMAGVMPGGADAEGQEEDAAGDAARAVSEGPAEFVGVLFVTETLRLSRSTARRYEAYELLIRDSCLREADSWADSMTADVT